MSFRTVGSTELQKTNLCSELDSEIEERCIAQKSRDAEEYIDYARRPLSKAKRKEKIDLLRSG